MAIRKASDGPLAGYTVVDIDLNLLAAFHAWCIDNGIGYGMGCKCSNIGRFPPAFVTPEGRTCTDIDCSGYVRAILDYASSGSTAEMPDGSYLEEGWFAHRGFKRTAYAECGCGDGLVRVGIHRPDGRGGDSIGHIWLVAHGQTVESCGGYGPHSQPWDNAWMIDHVDDCFVLG